MNSGLISSRYARALYIYASNHHKDEIIYKEAAILIQSYSDYPALKRVVADRLVSNRDKSEVIKIACGGADISPEFINFIDLVLTEGRAEMLLEMCLHYQSIMREARNLMDVSLTTAVAVDDKLMEQFRLNMEAMTDKRVIIKAKVDPSLTGGYVMKWDTYRLDASVRTRLERMKKYLTSMEYER